MHTRLFSSFSMLGHLLRAGSALPGAAGGLWPMLLERARSLLEMRTSQQLSR